MNHPAKFTNGVWELPAHARGVGPPVKLSPADDASTRVPPGERGLIEAREYGVKLADPSEPEDGWARI